MTTNSINRIRYPAYFAGKQAVLKQHSIPNRIKMIQEYAKLIKKGCLRYTINVLEIVAASDYDPDVMQPAREALAHITQLTDQDRHYEQFGFEKGKSEAYFLGLLYELLPRPMAIELFGQHHLRGDLHSPETVKGGQILLSFSSPVKAAEFIFGLLQGAHNETGKLVSCCRQWKVIRDYPFRRYEVPEILDTFNRQTSQGKFITPVSIKIYPK